MARRCEPDGVLFRVSHGQRPWHGIKGRVGEREIEYIKRELLHVVEQPKSKASLFGGVRGGDVTEYEVEEAKKGLFRELEEI